MNAPPTHVTTDQLKTLIDVEVLEDRRIEGGWLKLARRVLRNHYADGTSSEPYQADTAYRVGIDAVAIVPWRPRLASNGGRPASRFEILLRRFLRPGVDLRRRLREAGPDCTDPLPMMWEICAGIPEAHEQSPKGLVACAARELREEMGLNVVCDAVQSLGAAFFPSAGVLCEMIYPFAVEVNPDTEPGQPSGDDTPFEEAGELRWWSLTEALEACGRGEIADCKTELVLRRLAAEIDPR